MVFVSLLKVSSVPYRSFKDIDLRGKVPFIIIVLIILVFVFVSYDPPDVLCAAVTIYCLSGLVMWIVRKVFMRGDNNGGIDNQG